MRIISHFWAKEACSIPVRRKCSNCFPMNILYIITNGNAGTANTRIGHSGIGSYIKDYFVSEAVGAAKPDPLYFEYVFSHIPGFQKERAVVIGDSLASDIQGRAKCRAGQYLVPS